MRVDCSESPPHPEFSLEEEEKQKNGLERGRKLLIQIEKSENMASSQVEMASSSPFGCVLRDHNRRDGCRESNPFQKSFKNLVRDHHLHTCISIPSDENSRLPNNSEEKINKTKNGNPNYNERDNFPACQWRPLSAKRGKEMVTTTTTTTTFASERKSQEAELSALSNSNTPRALPRSDSLAGIQNLGGASSLVQIWENRMNRSNSTNRSSDSGLSSSNGNASSVEEEKIAPRGCEAGDSVHDERFDAGPASEDFLADWQSDKTVSSGQPSPARSRNSDAGENERVRIADIIKRLTAANQGQSTLSSSSGGSGGGDNDHEQSCSPLRELKRSQASDLVLEHRIFSPRIRGRQAFEDLLVRMERERHGERSKLAERGAVSRFAQRGRIQVRCSNLLFSSCCVVCRLKGFCFFFSMLCCCLAVNAKA